MQKYWGTQIFSLGRFPEVGQKQKTEKKKEREKTDFRAIFLLFTASVRSRPPGPPLVPGVLTL